MNPEAKRFSFSSDPQADNHAVILLVEDECVVREVTRQVLEHGGYRVLECNSPEEALRVFAAHRGEVDLLLTDVVMPGMNGPELAERMQMAQPDLVTVFMSGYAESDIVRRVRAIHLQKPFTVDALLGGVGEALRRSAECSQAASMIGS
jgi:two-component system cell cycle sensor histidine kinase/response regulator CckA